MEYRKGSTPPRKIEPNQLPSGVEKIITIMTDAVRSITVPEAMRGVAGQEVSGIAIQSRQFASQQQLALPLDNLARTRSMLAKRLDWFITNFMDSKRIFRITETDPITGEDRTEELMINVMQPDGTYLNDMTTGEYDLVITEQPMQITFENSQFQQTIEMKKVGISVPDKYAIKYSNLADKYDIMAEMSEQPQNDPLTDAKTKLALAQTGKVVADTVNSRVTAQFSATQAAQNIAAVPAVAPMADAMLGSAGFQDQNAPPAIPSVPTGTPAVEPAPRNTDPMTPQHADVGLNRGIEGGQ